MVEQSRSTPTKQKTKWPARAAPKGRNDSGGQRRAFVSSFKARDLARHGQAVTGIEQQGASDASHYAARHVLLPSSQRASTQQGSSKTSPPSVDPARSTIAATTATTTATAAATITRRAPQYKSTGSSAATRAVATLGECDECECVVVDWMNGGRTANLILLSVHKW